MNSRSNDLNCNFVFISIPNTGTASCFLELKRQSTRGDLPAELNERIELVALSDAKEAISASPASVAIVFAEPAERLYRAYLAQQGADKRGSFADFYRNPVRRNLYARLLGQVPIEKLGYVGLSSHPVKSSFMLKNWMNVGKGSAERFLHQEISLVGEAERNEIKKLHYRDYEIFELVCAEFEWRWSSFTPTFFHAGDVPSVNKEKEVIIHVGPPKTGTSAIQAWLLKHSEQLRESRIFYPTHNADENNISSGNFHHLMARGEDGFTFDIQKASYLINQFNNSEHTTLLLSSEHFNYCIVDLIRCFPQAKYVFYIRHPLLSHESHYHQSVKRHNIVNEFTPRIRWRFSALESIVSIVSEFGINISYRYYAHPLFEGGTLIDDFKKACGIEIASSVGERLRINTSYSFEALELMRRFNQFADDSIKHELDMWFQGKSIDHTKFTLYNADEIADAQRKLHLRIAPLHLNDSNLSVGKLTQLLNCLPDVQYRKQGELGTSALKLIHVLRNEKPELAFRLFKSLRSYNEDFNGKQMILNALKPGWRRRLLHFIKRR